MSSLSSSPLETIRQQQPSSFLSIPDSPLKTLPAIHSNSPNTTTNFSFSSLNISSTNITTIKQHTFKPSLNRLIASNNRLQVIQFKTMMEKLKYLDVSNNNLTSIKELIGSVCCLEELRVGNNKLKEIVRIPGVKYYYAMGNPVEKIQRNVCSEQLIHLAFDWMVYMSVTPDIMSNVEVLTVKLKQSLRINEQQQQHQFVNFREFLRIVDCKKLFQRKILEYTYTAIVKNHQQVFDFIEQHFYHLINLDQNRYQTKTLFQHSVHHNCKRAIQYFMKTGVKNTRLLKVDYLHIACRYNNIELFNQLIERGFNLNSLDSKGNTLLHEIISNFNSQSPPIFISIIKYHNNPNRTNKRQLNPLVYSANVSLISTIKFLKYVENNKHLVFLFDFDQICGYNYSENILHLGVRLLSFEMVKVIVDNQLVNPFVINSLKKRPRQMPSSAAIKKTLIKFEQRFSRKMMGMRDRIKKSFFQNKDQKQEKNNSENQSLQNKKVNHSVYKQLLQDNKSQRSMKVLKIIQTLQSLNCSKKFSQQIALNQSLNLNSKSSITQNISHALSQSTNKSQIGSFQQYNLFQSLLSTQFLGDSYQPSQNINSQIKFKINHSEIRLKVDDVPMQETKKFNKSISFPMNDFVEIKGGRRLKCLNIP